MAQKPNQQCTAEMNAFSSPDATGYAQRRRVERGLMSCYSFALCNVYRRREVPMVAIFVLHPECSYSFRVKLARVREDYPARYHSPAVLGICNCSCHDELLRIFCVPTHEVLVATILIHILFKILEIQRRSENPLADARRYQSGVESVPCHLQYPTTAPVPWLYLALVTDCS